MTDAEIWSASDQVARRVRADLRQLPRHIDDHPDDARLSTTMAAAAVAGLLAAEVTQDLDDAMHARAVRVVTENLVEAARVRRERLRTPKENA